MDYKGIRSYFIGFFNPLENTCSQKNVIAVNGIAIQYKHIILEADTKVGCFARFCHHHLMTMSLRIAILCLKVVWKHVCERLLYAEKIEYY